MNLGMPRSWRQWTLYPLLILLITAYVHFACTTGNNKPDVGTNSIAYYQQQCTQPIDQVVVDCPALPDTLPTYNFQTDTPSAADYESFAWRSFIALNWPARIPSNQTSPQFARGFPDYNQTFLGAAYDDVGVWESWREKRELFFYGTNLSAPPTPNPPTPPTWNGPTDYGNNAYVPPIVTCPGSNVTPDDFHRTLGAVTKANSLDEALEVPSQANPNASVTGAVAGAAVEPQVFETVNGNLQSLLFEVKLNYDYYTYTRIEGLFQDSVATPLAAANGMPGVPTINFPCRGFRDASSNQCASYFDQALNPTAPNYRVEECVAENANLSDHPCVSGTIQTKSGWKLLTQAEINSQDFHTTEAIYYLSNDNVPGGICLETGTFGLIGFHIIQKTVGQPYYLYATWEHDDNETAGFSYSNFFLGGVVPSGQNVSAGYYPPLNGSLIPVKREAGRILSGTQTTNQNFHNAFGCSGANPPVWCNYRLIGTQFIPLDARPGCDQNPTSTNCNTPFEDFGQPFYLANLVVETNWGLQNFQGTPPGIANVNIPAAFTPTDGYQHGRNGSRANYVANNAITFNRSLYNAGYHRMASQPNPANQPLAYGAVFNMGGCMGCHGVSQSAGYDFSFVLKRGQSGSKPETANGFGGE
ncbi:MAG: hypothetical protein AAF481_12140 [Acidobacteriota bacterium]